jgi:hypothetical protein
MDARGGSGASGDVPSTVGRSRTGGISWAYVAIKVVALSALTWTLTAGLAAVFSASEERGIGESLHLAAWIAAGVVLLGGVVGAARGPVPLSREASRGLVRPLGILTRAQDVIARPLRSRTDEVRETDRPQGLAPLGLALVIVFQLVLVATLLEL